jgi:peptide-methionine (R)-S-oxide reductase
MDKEELKNKLPKKLYRIAFAKGTEMPFTGKYLHEKAAGMYNCAVCGNKLFESDAKFDSGTGWPSFDQAIEGAVKYEHDETHNMKRTEVLCANCGAHLGHVFDDGPKQTTGKRYCINSACLNLKKK